MFVDASVLVAILVQESGWQELARRLDEAGSQKFTSPIARFETVLGASRAGAEKRGVRPSAEDMEIVEAAVADLLAGFGIVEMAIESGHGTGAIAASRLYGKVVGHAARLNLGDCFAYACAKQLKVPLLYKGGDFARTDLA